MLSFSENAESLRTHLISFHSTVEYYQKAHPEMGIAQIADGYIKNQIDCENGMKSYFEYLEEVGKKNNRLLRAIKSVKGKTFTKHLVEFIKDAEAVDHEPWQIVSHPVGKEQDVSEYGREIKKEWVDQHAVGMEGDGWAGTICIKLKPNKYLKFSFSM